LAFIIFKAIPVFFNTPYYDDKIFPKIFIPSLLVFTFIYIVVGEIRTKFIIVEITENKIIVKRFFGLKREIFKFSEIKGWKYSYLSSIGGTYEYLYFYKNNRKVIKISEFYHKNYYQLKSHIQTKFDCLGYEKFSMIDE